MPGSGAMMLLAFVGLVAVILLILLQLTRLGYLIRSSIPDRPRRRMFIASFSFLVTFIGVRLLVHRIVNHQGHFEWVVVRGHHIHHLVWGILILLLVGYGWLLDLGRSHSPMAIFFSRMMSVGYGVGAALTLDEFALWLDLEPNAYWSDEGRLSIDAIILFGGLLAVGAGGAPFFQALQRMWAKRFIVRKGLGRISSPIRHARLPRPHRLKRSAPHNEN